MRERTARKKEGKKREVREGRSNRRAKAEVKSEE